MTQPPADVIAGAQAGERATHIPASVTLAQWALESGWGKHSPGNNPFGIKHMVGYDDQQLPTHEFVHGHMVSVDQPFAVFPDIATAIMVHDHLLATAPCYAPARSKLPDAIAFAHALTGVYATDPNYGHWLEQIIRGSNLTQYDASPIGEDLDD